MMLLMLLIILEINCLAAEEDDLLDDLIRVNPGNFLPEKVVLKIIEQYPELEQVFENTLKVGSGYYMSDGTTIELANYAQDVNDENTRLEAINESLRNALKEERKAAQLVFDEKDNVIELKNEQLKDYKELYRNKDPDIWEKAKWAAGGAGIIAVIILLANIN